MGGRKEKNNRAFEHMENTTSGITKDDAYVEENFHTTDSDAAENDPRIKHASQVTGNTVEEGDEDYDDEQEKDQE